MYTSVSPLVHQARAKPFPSFPEGTFFIRLLKAYDNLQIMRLLELEEYSFDEDDPCYGVFDQHLTLHEMFETYQQALCALKETDQQLLWMH